MRMREPGVHENSDCLPPPALQNYYEQTGPIYDVGTLYTL